MAEPAKATARPSLSLDMWKDFEYNKDADEKFAYNVEPHLVPEGFSVEWKRVEILGKPDRKNMVIVESKGWRPYPADLYLSLGGKLAIPATGNVVEDGHGMMLMVRPLEFTARAVAENYQAAIGKVKDYDKLALAGLTKHDDIKPRMLALNRTVENPKSVAVPD